AAPAAVVAAGEAVGAVLPGGRGHAGRQYPAAPGLGLVRRGRPGHMVHGARALDTDLPGRLVVGVRGAPDVAPRLPEELTSGLEAHRLLQERPARVRVGRVRANSLEALERMLGRDLGMLGG